MTSLSTPVRTHVEAELNYLQPNGARPVNYAYPAPAGVPQSSGIVSTHRVSIANARVLSQPPTLDSHGFTLVPHRSQLSSVEEYLDERVLRERYYAESSELIKRVTGAEHVVIFDHTLRLDIKDHQQAGIREPVRRVHNDQTFVSGPRRVRDHLPPAEAEERLGHRFAILNLWRPIGAPVETAPLALCDARSIAESDLIPTDLVYRDKVGETYSFTYDARHRWFYYPQITPDEVVLLKIYDSRSDGRARLTAHTAFDDPNSPSDAPARRSIELRTLAFWPAGS